MHPIRHASLSLEYTSDTDFSTFFVMYLIYRARDLSSRTQKVYQVPGTWYIYIVFFVRYKKVTFLGEVQPKKKGGSSLYIYCGTRPMIIHRPPCTLRTKAAICRRSMGRERETRKTVGSSTDVSS